MLERMAGLRWRSTRGLVAVLVAAGLSSGCTAAGSHEPTATPAPSASATPAAAPAIVRTFELTSTAWAEGGSIPHKYTCEGDRTSPPMKWNGAPSDTVEFLLIMDDYGASITHWIVVGIPGGSSGSLPEGFANSPSGSARSLFYLGPCPAPGINDEYQVTVYALSSPLTSDMLTHMSAEIMQLAIQNEIAGHVLAEATLSGWFMG